MGAEYEKLTRCLEKVRALTDFVPEVALTLGSGLGGFIDCMEVEAVIPYTEIDGFPVSTVPGHAGRFILGGIGGVKTAAMQGRVHYYEGYSAQDVVLPARLLSLMGAKVLFLTNAAGGINPSFEAGDFMLIRDHILNFFPNPLVGPNEDELGTRFPDMSEVYDAALRCIIKAAAAGNGIALKEGVYAQLTGPSFETPAEIGMLRLLGADAVGMSTACEAVAARHAGMKVCGVSCIANKAAGLSKTPLTHAEVQAAADEAAPRFRTLVQKSVEGIGRAIKNL